MGPRGLKGTSALPVSLAVAGPFRGPWEFPLKGPTAAGDTGKAPGSPWRLEGREERAFGLGAQKGQGGERGGGQPAGSLSRTGGLRLPGMYLSAPLPLSCQDPDPAGQDPSLAPITSCRTPSPIPSLVPSHREPQSPLIPLQHPPQDPSAPSHNPVHASSPRPIPSSAQSPTKPPLPPLRAHHPPSPPSIWSGPRGRCSGCTHPPNQLPPSPAAAEAAPLPVTSRSQRGQLFWSIRPRLTHPPHQEAAN